MLLHKCDLSDQFTGLACLDSLIPKSHDSIGLHAVLGGTGVGTTRIAAMTCANLAVSALRKDGEERPVFWVGCQAGMEEVRELIMNHLGDSKSAIEALDYIKYISGRMPKAHFGQVAKMLNDRESSAIVIDDFESLIGHQLGMSANGSQISRLMNAVLQSLALAARERGIPIWVTHKLRGNLGRKDPRAILTHRDASSCKRFGEHFDTCLVAGNHDSLGLFKVVCSKPVEKKELREAVVHFSVGAKTLALASEDDQKQFRSRSWQEPAIVVSRSVSDVFALWDQHAERHPGPRLICFEPC